MSAASMDSFDRLCRNIDDEVPPHGRMVRRYTDILKALLTVSAVPVSTLKPLVIWSTLMTTTRQKRPVSRSWTRPTVGWSRVRTTHDDTVTYFHVEGAEMRSHPPTPAPDELVEMENLRTDLSVNYDEVLKVSLILTLTHSKCRTQIIAQKRRTSSRERELPWSSVLEWKCPGSRGLEDGK